VKKLFLAVLLVTVPLSALAETESLTKYRALAKQGDANAEFNIGLIYYEGRSASEEGIWVEAIGESIRQGSRGSILDTELLADKIWDKVVGKKSPNPIEQAEQAWARMDSSEKRSAQREPGLKARCGKRSSAKITRTRRSGSAWLRNMEMPRDNITSVFCTTGEKASRKTTQWP